MIKQLLNSVIAKYRDLSVSRRSIICRSRRLRQIIDLLASDKSRYFAQPPPIIVKCATTQMKVTAVSHSLNLPRGEDDRLLSYLSLSLSLKKKGFFYSLLVCNQQSRNEQLPSRVENLYQEFTLPACSDKNSRIRMRVRLRSEHFGKSSALTFPAIFVASPVDRPPVP